MPHGGTKKVTGNDPGTSVSKKSAAKNAPIKKGGQSIGKDYGMSPSKR